MHKKFNITGLCIPQKNYMVNINSRINKITTEYIQEGKYFTINRGRQYGKTTTLYLLEQQLKNRYLVIPLSFEACDELFVSLHTLATGLVRKIGRVLKALKVKQTALDDWNQPISEQFPLDDLGERITSLCNIVDQEIVLIVDEVDKSSNNQIFLSFLGLLRNKYLEQLKGNDHTFLSVILAGVYDIKNLKVKLHPGEESKYNSPWNIAVDFTVNMDFMPEDISVMLAEYEKDYQTGMDIDNISRQIYDYTSGYPYLVSRLCQIADEKLPGTEDFPDRHSVWTHRGMVASELLLRKESNTLFDDMIKKLAEYPKLKQMLRNILFCGSIYPFERDNDLINLGVTFAFLKERNGIVAVKNRIFETKLYDLFLSEMYTEDTNNPGNPIGRNQYIADGSLQMNLVMEKFYQHFTEIYGDSDWKFLERQGRTIFLMYIKPIINGTGNYYIEAQTRDMKRTDIIIDYQGKQFIIELKIWHGNEYHQRGEKQLFEYLDYYGVDTGYLLSFNFNKNKKTGIQEITQNGKRILEVVV
ncbi:MAG: AAA family ATPase [Lachnospiraceae bacterium]|nr:AAA family ATPase [Lachnospiraceae bacterium]MCI8960056.1 AAA family ATPase [Lachnospiraceae bacterium]